MNETSKTSESVIKPKVDIKKAPESEKKNNYALPWFTNLIIASFKPSTLEKSNDKKGKFGISELNKIAIGGMVESLGLRAEIGVQLLDEDMKFISK